MQQIIMIVSTSTSTPVAWEELVFTSPRISSAWVPEKLTHMEKRRHPTVSTAGAGCRDASIVFHFVLLPLSRRGGGYEGYL